LGTPHERPTRSTIFMGVAAKSPVTHGDFGATRRRSRLLARPKSRQATSRATGGCLLIFNIPSRLVDTSKHSALESQADTQKLLCDWSPYGRTDADTVSSSHRLASLKVSARATSNVGIPRHLNIIS
jgi:hypothetical protein